MKKLNEEIKPAVKKFIDDIFSTIDKEGNPFSGELVNFSGNARAPAEKFLENFIFIFPQENIIENFLHGQDYQNIFRIFFVTLSQVDAAANSGRDFFEKSADAFSTLERNLLEELSDDEEDEQSVRRFIPLGMSIIKSDFERGITSHLPEMAGGEAEPRLFKLNNEIKQLINKFLPENFKSKVDIIFDLPEGCKPENIQKPTISVFLYDIHEEVEMRHSESSRYDSITRKIKGEDVRVRCCYLITCWQPLKNQQKLGRCDSMILADIVLNALINNRALPGMPEAYCRVLPPTEQLKSLGSFWQALGNQPRLSMSYLVTVPIPLRSNADVVQSVLPESMSLQLVNETVMPAERMKLAKTLVELIDAIVGDDEKPKAKALSDLCNIVLGKDGRFGSDVKEINTDFPADTAKFIASRSEVKFKTMTEYNRMVDKLGQAVATYKETGPMVDAFKTQAKEVFLVNLKKHAPKAA